MTSQILATTGERPILRQNECNEATAFDRIAERRDQESLKTSDWTFSRYRRAVLGHPLYHAYPDRAFVQIGRRFAPGGDPRRPLKGVRVLDLGAGDGVWSVILAEQGADVSSIEISPRQVALARQRMRLHDLLWDARVGSAYSLAEQFPPASFDLIFAEAVLHHLTLDLERVYDGMRSLLREGGHATVTEPYCASPRLRRIRERMSWVVPLDRESPDERPLNDDDLLSLARYFPSLAVERFDLLAKFGRRVFRSHDLQRALFHFDRFVLQKKMFMRLAGGIFITARK
jgi:SAM-dependent methyltransferase